MLAVGAERGTVPQVLAAKFSEKLKYNARLVGGGSGVTFNSDGAAMVEHGPECIKWASGVYSVEFRCTRRTRADGTWIGVHYVDDARVGRVVDAGLGQRRHLRTHPGSNSESWGWRADGRITSPPLVRASGVSVSQADDLKWGENDVLTLTLDSHSMTLRLAKNGRPLDGRIELGSGQMGSHRSGGLFFSVGRYYGELHVTLLAADPRRLHRRRPGRRRRRRVRPLPHRGRDWPVGGGRRRRRRRQRRRRRGRRRHRSSARAAT